MDEDTKKRFQVIILVVFALGVLSLFVDLTIALAFFIAGVFVLSYYLLSTRTRVSPQVTWSSRVLLVFVGLYTLEFGVPEFVLEPVALLPAVILVFVAAVFSIPR
jgi:hypothetical protein